MAYEALPGGGEGGLVGYLCWAALGGGASVGVVSVVVHPDWRRLGVATSLLADLHGRSEGRTLGAVARETNLAFQLLLKANGYYCDRTLEGVFSDPPCDGLRFVLRP